MDKTRIDKAIDIIAPLMCAFPNAKITDDTIGIYALALSELSPEELQAGVLKCMRTCKFFPTIAEIMEKAQEIVEVVSDTQARSCEDAWKEVLTQMEKAFVYRKPEFSTPEVEKAALSMGWTSLCNLLVDGMNTARAQFLRIYESVCKGKREDRINGAVLNVMGESSVKQLVSKTAGAVRGMNLLTETKKTEVEKDECKRT